jgi:site-specific DNA recombinase
MRAVIYARYSSDLQRDASIEDQLSLCGAQAEREGWTMFGPTQIGQPAVLMS